MSDLKTEKKSFKLGLTGSIGMGKTTVAGMFLSEGIPVWSADETVNSLYKKNQSGYKIIKSFLPTAINDKGVNKVELSKLVLEDKNLLKRLESEIHPLVKRDRNIFVDRFYNERLLVFELPLLYETEEQRYFDSVLVVTAPKQIQKKRVMKRGFMTKKKFDYLSVRQISNDKKVSMADYVIDTNVEISMLRETVKNFIDALRKKI